MADEPKEVHDLRVAVAQLTAVQAAHAVTISRFERTFEKLEDVFTDALDNLKDDIRERLADAKADREKFQHDIREAVTGMQATQPDIVASKHWIENTGKPMHTEHESWKGKVRALVWVGGLISFGLGGSAVEVIRAVLKSKGIIS